MVTTTTRAEKVRVGDLPDGHPIPLLIEQRAAAVARQQRCMETYHRARENAIRHRALAKENEAEIERIDATIAMLLPKEDDDAGS